MQRALFFSSKVSHKLDTESIYASRLHSRSLWGPVNARLGCGFIIVTDILLFFVRSNFIDLSIGHDDLLSTCPIEHQIDFEFFLKTWPETPNLKPDAI